MDSSLHILKCCIDVFLIQYKITYMSLVTRRLHRNVQVFVFFMHFSVDLYNLYVLVCLVDRKVVHPAAANQPH